MKPHSPRKAKNIENACEILHTHKTWADAFERAYNKYKVPPHVVMAIMYQESHFVHNARPMKKFFGISMQASTAYGYSQALDQTWQWYKDETGKKNAKRTYFPDAVDFIGWYLNENNKRTGVSKWDTGEQYLAYHEGTGGYLRQSYLKKPWLVKVAKKVDDHSKVYYDQLLTCFKDDKKQPVKQQPVAIASLDNATANIVGTDTITDEAVNTNTSPIQLETNTANAINTINSIDDIDSIGNYDNNMPSKPVSGFGTQILQ